MKHLRKVRGEEKAAQELVEEVQERKLHLEDRSPPPHFLLGIFRHAKTTPITAVETLQFFLSPPSTWNSMLTSPDEDIRGFHPLSLFHDDRVSSWAIQFSSSYPPCGMPADSIIFDPKRTGFGDRQHWQKKQCRKQKTRWPSVPPRRSKTGAQKRLELAVEGTVARQFGLKDGKWDK